MKKKWRLASLIFVRFALLLPTVGLNLSAYAEDMKKETEIEIIPLRNTLYLFVADGTNIVASIGPDGVLLVDSGPEETADEFMRKIKKLNNSENVERNEGVSLIGGSETRSNTKMIFSTIPEIDNDYIRYILNTSGLKDHISGASRLARIPTEMSAQDPNEKVTKIHAHENVLLRLSGAIGESQTEPYELWPSDVYYEDYYKFPHFNGESVQMLHVPEASTDGDSIVLFRNSDIIVAGDIYRTDSYPIPNIELGGSIQGIIKGLNILVDLAVPEYRAEGGTLIIPGHGRVSDIGDLGNYRAMVTIIKDRVQALMDKGLDLEQIQSRRPSLDYDARYGKEEGSSEKFIEAIYSSLKVP